MPVRLNFEIKIRAMVTNTIIIKNDNFICCIHYALRTNLILLIHFKPRIEVNTTLDTILKQLIKKMTLDNTFSEKSRETTLALEP